MDLRGRFQYHPFPGGKRGGNRRLDGDNEGLKNLIDNLHMVDLENTNCEFTWTNMRSGSKKIACCLDRFLISKPLMLDGLLMEANILFVAGFDHWPIQLWIDVVSSPHCKPFRFDKFWLTHHNI